MAPARSRAPIALRAGMLPWLPFWMGLGIGLWFALRSQPGAAHYLAASAVAVLAICLALGAGRLVRLGHVGWDRGDMLRIWGIAIFMVALGFLLIGLRSWSVAAPILDFRYYGAVEGRVVEIDRSSGDRLRLTLDQVVLERVAPDRTPRHVRISLFVTDPMPVPGQHVMTTAHLGPPNGPAEPGGFDFRRLAWFEGLGAVGYSRVPVLTVAPPHEGGMLALHRLRMRISQAMMDSIGGQAGAVASALMTGDRSGIAEATNDVMRASSLYHIISISGLHMTMLAGFVYAAVRLLGVGVQLCGVPLGTRLHKWAAGVALLAALLYLWISGGGVATERSFIMVAVMLLAIIADRRAVSLRTVALAAMVLFFYMPEGMTSAGFQMSFSATVALILSQRPWQSVQHHVPALLRPAAMLILASVAAGLATTPFAAAHFGRMSQYGTLANLLVVPVVGTIVMPAGVIAAVLAPLGMAQPALWLMGLGTKWMLFIAEWVAGLNGAVAYLPAPPGAVLPLLGVGACLVVLAGLRGTPDAARLSAPHRLLGMACLVAAAVIWGMATRPQVLISAEGDAVGVMTAQGRAMSRPRGGSFTVSNWLDADGDRADQTAAAARPLWQGPENHRQTVLQAGGRAVTLHHLSGKRGAENAAALCRKDTILVANTDLPIAKDAPCLVLDPARLRRSGAVALNPSPAGLNIVTVRTASGARDWTDARRNRGRD
ncbi:ComEC/Rec2 family competence protein [Paracoccus shanxieyensis]|nr:ComEC/Rec2 family competence protein [Paracoccus shanxieyensis]